MLTQLSTTAANPAAVLLFVMMSLRKTANGCNAQRSQSIRSPPLWVLTPTIRTSALQLFRINARFQEPHAVWFVR